VGRTSTLTPEAHDAIVEAVALGATDKEAAKQAGVGYRSLCRWQARGALEEPDVPVGVCEVCYGHGRGAVRVCDECEGLGGDDLEAIEAFKIACKPLVYWRLWQSLQGARAKRRESILLRLPEYRDWKADDAYLKHLRGRDLGELQRRKLAAEVVRAECEARAAEAKADEVERALGEGGGGFLVVGLDGALDMMPPDLRETVELWMLRSDVGMVRRRNLSPDIEELAAP
jgi:hypothetical protein